MPKSPRPASVVTNAEPEAAPIEPELVLVRRAKSQLAGGESAEALETLATRARVYPNGTLEEEASALRILALASIGSPSAREEAARFAKTHPESPYGERIETALKKLSVSSH